VAEDARRAAEDAARASYGRLVAILAARTRDVAAAEDALADAFAAALSAWPERGVPANPEAWLLTAARRGLSHGRRHAGVADAALPTMLQLAEEAEDREAHAIPDERLRLLFVCAHPAIDPAARAPLMLQTVLGLDAARIASAFLVAPATMGQRLVRAKARIRDAGIRFAVPEPAEMPERLESVLDAVYAAYGSGWDDVDGADPRRRGLADEALWLARLVAALLPDEPEPKGLLALILHCEARRPARRGPGGRFVPLAEQDPSLWSRTAAAEAEAALEAAARAGRLGRFQLEAAIQSAHAARARLGAVPWRSIALMYEALVRIAPTAGALVGRAAAVAEAAGAEAGLALLDDVPADLVAAYQPAWALRAHLLSRLGRPDEARAARVRAAGLSEDPAVRAFLLEGEPSS
jgi:RNA polymerase sigma-70 factor (ECF subfamily)